IAVGDVPVTARGAGGSRGRSGQRAPQVGDRGPRRSRRIQEGGPREPLAAGTFGAGCGWHGKGQGIDWVHGVIPVTEHGGQSNPDGPVPASTAGRRRSFPPAPEGDLPPASGPTPRSAPAGRRPRRKRPPQPPGAARPPQAPAPGFPSSSLPSRPA